MVHWRAKDLLPAEVEGRRPLGPPRVFSPSNLSKYIDGGAALYLAYDFRELAVASYPTGSGDDKITVEIYRMGKSEDAFGVYSDGAEGEHPPVGCEASYGEGLLRFWKGCAFVRILWLSAEPGVRDRIVALGRAIAERVPERCVKPRLVRILPPEGLIADRAVYFHTVVSLNHLYYLCDGNPLGLGPQTEAVLAEYEIGRHAPKLLLIRYPSARAAASALERFERVYLADRPPRPAERRGGIRIEVLEDKLALGAVREGRLVVLCFEAGVESASSLVAEALRRYEAEFGRSEATGGG